FGGQGLAKTARATSIKKSGHPDVHKRAFAMVVGILHAEDSYMDVLISILLRLIQSEPQAATKPMLAPANSRIQSLSIDLLQTIISRGDMGFETLENIETVIVAKCFAAIHTNRLDIQPKLLHILHSVILAISTIPSARQGKSKADAALALAALESSGTAGSTLGDELSTKKLAISSLNPLLTQTLLDGISEVGNRPILQHWLDFILTTIPQFSQSMQQLSYPLSDCICKQLNGALLTLDRVINRMPLSNENKEVVMSDSEFVMLLHALERLVLQGLSKGDMP
ncbi:17528_t:CDS:2, partial [Acaulospora colombiana]